MCANHISSPVSLLGWLLLDLIQTDCSTAAKTCQMLLTAPRFITIYLARGISQNIFLLITSQRSVSLLVFAASFRILVMILGTRAWKNHCPSFSLASITLVSGCGEGRRRRRRWRRDLTQDILPRLVRVTDRSDTCRRSGRPRSRAERWRDDWEAGREQNAHV